MAMLVPNCSAARFKHHRLGSVASLGLIGTAARVLAGGGSPSSEISPPHLMLPNEGAERRRRRWVGCEATRWRPYGYAPPSCEEGGGPVRRALRLRRSTAASKVQGPFWSDTGQSFRSALASRPLARPPRPDVPPHGASSSEGTVTLDSRDVVASQSPAGAAPLPIPSMPAEHPSWEEMLRTGPRIF